MELLIKPALALLCSLIPMVMYGEDVLIKGYEKISGSYVLADNMLSGKGCRYIVRDIFDLQGKELKLGEGSSLVFDGGCLKNGVIVVEGDPFPLENHNDRVILDEVYFKNETRYGYQNRCIQGICKDSWLNADSDDTLLDMAMAFDGVILTRPKYSLSRDVSTSQGYPSKYRWLAKKYSIASNSGRSHICTQGQIGIIRQNIYGQDNDSGLCLSGIDIEDVLSSYSYSDFVSTKVANKAFFGGALNNFGYQFHLDISDCSFKGVYQLMQWNCHNEGLNVNMKNVDMYCGSFGMEVYNGSSFRRLRMRAEDCRFESYFSYVFSFVSVDADIEFKHCRIGGLELYHKGMVSFMDCNIEKCIVHSGELLQGSVSIVDSKLHRGGHYDNALVFDFWGMKHIMIKNSVFAIDAMLFENYDKKRLAERPLLSFKRCPNAIVDGCFLVEEPGVSFDGLYCSDIPIRVFDDGSRLKMRNLSASKECSSALAKGKVKYRHRVLRSVQVY